MVVLVFGMTGCANLEAVKHMIAVNGAEANDEAIETAIWTLCAGALYRVDRAQVQHQRTARCAPEHLPPASRGGHAMKAS
ncbi:MAG: hypothetical protein U5N53_22970 [Mycobacterium sp.]|nr:hypothetical protein [Mycobacterium sp.]